MISRPDIKDVESYITGFPAATQKLLKQLRTTIRKAAPGAEEYIGYQMPAYKFHGPLVYFAGYERHIGFYPGASGIENFKKEIAGYKHAKGSVQFPLDKPLPLDLVKQIVAFRIQENLGKTEAKRLKKKNK
ncbi:iron chaperone [Ferruginibacter sp. HRS2-29]|uniref:iron chaperone n=1 Tax=Ferruginibacter sp. HRS2-29 TaxID=2487334 RepID=UPI0020CEAD65|nr:DUF1801 domain-containing protein [Ferruginibacter sp. HRS2-29]MCP9753346.1 hypothetical protein [Ferruginibacter sp. HRS2-29]